MGESLVGLGHLVHILATLYGVTAVVGSVENLTRQTVSHGALGALAGKLDQPAQRQSLTYLLKVPTAMKWIPIMDMLFHGSVCCRTFGL